MGILNLDDIADRQVQQGRLRYGDACLNQVILPSGWIRILRILAEDPNRLAEFNLLKEESVKFLTQLHAAIKVSVLVDRLRMSTGGPLEDLVDLLDSNRSDEAYVRSIISKIKEINV